MVIKDRLQHAWNAFIGKDDINIGLGYSTSQSTYRSVNNVSKGSITSTIFNRIAIDASMASFSHVKVNPENEDEEVVHSGLHECLTVEANIDQSHIQFMHDLIYSMFDEGVVAVVPVDTTLNPELTGSYDIKTLRVGRITSWYPRHVEVELYNDNTGQNERITIEKRNVAILENPLYAVVNGENSTLKRLINKLSQMDNVDTTTASGRLDLLISVPYAIKTKAQQEMALQRIKDIENQLANGKNGIAYIDGTETVTQMNRPVNSQLKETVAELKQELYNQLGLTQAIFDGTAGEQEQRNYYNRAIDPLLETVVAEFTRKFLTKTARSQGHKIKHYRDIFKFVSIEVIAQLGDTFRRNSITSSNEIRRIINLRPSSDPRADELFNPNIADKNQSISGPAPEPQATEPKEEPTG